MEFHSYLRGAFIQNLSFGDFSCPVLSFMFEICCIFLPVMLSHMEVTLGCNFSPVAVFLNCYSIIVKFQAFWAIVD